MLTYIGELPETATNNNNRIFCYFNYGYILSTTKLDM